MRWLVGYNGTPEAKAALNIALQLAAVAGAEIYLVSSAEGGSRETLADINALQDSLEAERDAIVAKGIACQVHQVVRGLSPGEDLVWFARENGIDHMFVGIEKKSKTQKILLGSTAQYVILKSPCPVTTVK